MPNWVTNNIVITGPQDTLEMFAAVGLSFMKLHPRPEELYEDWHTWNVTHWGTKWEPDTIIPLLLEGKLVATFDTAWSPPDAFLTYLTEFYDGIKIVNRFTDESWLFVGHSVISHGVICTEMFEPTDFTNVALANFASTNTWYNHGKFTAMLHSLNDCYGDGACDCVDVNQRDLKDKVEVNTTTLSYTELITRALPKGQE